MIDKVNKKHLLIFTLLVFVLMIMPLSFASDDSSLNQTILKYHYQIMDGEKWKS